jgi:hypothetical protein
MMIRAANLLMDGRRIRGIASDAEVRPNWAPIAQRIRQDVTDNWDDKVAVDRFVSKGASSSAAVAGCWGLLVSPPPTVSSRRATQSFSMSGLRR